MFLKRISLVTPLACATNTGVPRSGSVHRVVILDRIPKLNFGALGGLAVFMLIFGVQWGAAAWVFHAVADILLKLGMCLTQVGTVWQRFVWLTHWHLRPASSSGTKASRAVQGDRPTWTAAVVII